MSLRPQFQLHLPEKVLSGRVALGRFDGCTTSLAYATAAGKVFLYNPHDNSSNEQQRINVNMQITVLGAGILLPNSTREVLLIGTPSCLHCYDVKHNRDLFYKDIPDGVQSLAVGPYGSQNAMLVVVGGAGSITGFNSAGEEVFWKAVSGSATAVALVDVDNDGCNELLVGCDDAIIRIYKDDEVLQQITEADAISQLTGLGQGQRWAYALANGTIGVYESGLRLWRVKSKHIATSLCGFDLGLGSNTGSGNGKGGGGSGGGGGSKAAGSLNSHKDDSNDTCSHGWPHLLIGWSGGRVEARSNISGEAVARDNFGSCIAALLCGQLRQADNGELEVLAVSTDGELRGYLAQHEEMVADVGGDVSAQQRMLIDLAQKKQQLIYELASYQATTSSAAATNAHSFAAGLGGLSSNLNSLTPSAVLAGLSGAHASSGASAGDPGGGSSSSSAHSPAAVLPPDTCVHSAVTVNKARQTCELMLKTNNSTVIQAALIFGEQVFEGESLLVAPQQPESTLIVPMTPRRDMPVLLLMKVLVGSRTGRIYHVFELSMELPKFAAYAVERQAPAEGIPASHVCFELQQPTSKLAAWLEARFGAHVLLASPAGNSSAQRHGSGGTRDGPLQEQLMAHFTCVRTRQPLAVQATSNPGGGMKVCLHSDSMEMAGDLLQDLAAWLGVTDLDSIAKFPAVMAEFKQTVAKVQAATAARSAVAADAAQTASAIKAAVVRAEDSRLLRDVAGLKHAHKRLADLNRDMWLEHSRRVRNHEELVSGLKTINQMIQAAAGLRVGPAQVRVVAACRAAIKANNLQGLENVIVGGV